MSVRVFAPAKINLTLQVGRPRADGMHPLQSVVVFADVGDWITAEADSDITLEVRGPFASSLEGENLVLKAASLLSEDAQYSGAKLTLEKNLPVASGIGGGSSDAAATLKALNRLWRLRASEDALAPYAVQIGADVSVCVPARSAWMTGVGDVVDALDVPPLNAVLVNPRLPLPTPKVFRQFDYLQLGSGFVERPAPVWRTRDQAVAGIAAMGNDLDTPARALMLAIAEIATVLEADARTRCVALSGSGATLFALVDDETAAEGLAHDLQSQHPEWWVVSTVLAGA